MTVTGGTTIPGRLVPDGKPVAKAEVGLVTHTRSSGTMFSEALIGTQGGWNICHHKCSGGTRLDSLSHDGIAGRPEHLRERCELRDEG